MALVRTTTVRVAPARTRADRTACKYFRFGFVRRPPQPRIAHNADNLHRIVKIVEARENISSDRVLAGEGFTRQSFADYGRINRARVLVLTGMDLPAKFEETRTSFRNSVESCRGGDLFIHLIVCEETSFRKHCQE